jgi:plastocyanin
MSRAAAAVALIAVAGTLLLAPVGLDPVAAGSEQASAADCIWQRHAKRVVKRIKRHGEVRRVKRWKHIWSCDPVAAQPPVPAPAPTPVPTPTPPTSEPTPEPPAANRLSVKSAEFTYTLSRPSVSAGELTIELNNLGEDPHNLNLGLEGSEDSLLEIAETPSQQRQTAKVTLPAGSYRLWCSLDMHEEKGMSATLVVASD